MSAIDVRGLTVRYRGARAPAVDGMDFTVERGEVFGLLGPSGAGKSTVHRVLTRRIRRFGGTVSVLGAPVGRGRDRDFFERIGVGFELPAHLPALTARENLAVFAGLHRGPTEDPGTLLDLLDLTDAADRRTADFSKGMLVRLNLARALVNRPELLLVDEPTSGLDPVRAEHVRQILRDRARRGSTVVVTTHDMLTAERVCDRIAFVVDGRVVAGDGPRRLRLAHGRPGVVVEFRRNGHLERAELPMDTLAEPLGITGSHVETVHSREATLDDVFARVTGRRIGREP
ncbi:ABC transporter ATP-binding protein [Nocardiopsis lucentensis]|uniref:ABC transporter ATP-binding protein n=1 Tax=Nocardiopsis lucentensis TaxID=53441 RepID=UPI00034CC676|nr:ABC transporter ATP-binding protein [Nocardiopsis lucentensis]